MPKRTDDSLRFTITLKNTKGFASKGIACVIVPQCRGQWQNCRDNNCRPSAAAKELVNTTCIVTVCNIKLHLVLCRELSCVRFYI